MKKTYTDQEIIQAQVKLMDEEDARSDAASDRIHADPEFKKIWADCPYTEEDEAADRALEASWPDALPKGIPEK